MTVNLSALLTKKSNNAERKDFVCRKGGEGQDKAFNNFVLLIKAH